MSKLSPISAFKAIKKLVSENKFLRWGFVFLFAWLIPSIVFWSGIYMFINEYQSRENGLIQDQAANDLISYSYDATPTRYWHPKFDNLYKQFKGLRFGTEALETIVADFKKNWPKDSLDIYLFDGSFEISENNKNTPEHKLFFELINKTRNDLAENQKDSTQKQQLQDEEIKKIGKVFPAPELILNRVQNKPNTVIELGNPDKYSFCYFNYDKTIKSKFVAGILIFVHSEKITQSFILKDTLTKKNPQNYGFITDSLSVLPKEADNITAEVLSDYFQQYPTNSFRLKNKIFTLHKTDSGAILISAFNAAPLPYPSLSLIAFFYLVATVLFSKITYSAFIKNIFYRYNMKQRLIALFSLCYGLPLLAAIFLAVQYLYKLEHRILLEEQMKSYRKLSETDKGFDRFLTSKLVEFKKLTNRLKKHTANPKKLIQIADSVYKNYLCDSFHLISSQTEILYNTELTGAEIRRHMSLSSEEKEKIYETWTARNATISERHRQALFENIEFKNIAQEDSVTSENNNFRILLSSTALSAMDFYNNSKGISTPIKRSPSTLIVDSIIESTTQSLFQSAHTNISKFTTIQGIDEIILGYIDILPGPLNKEAWYCYVMLIDLILFEREYLTDIFAKTQKNIFYDDEYCNNKIAAISGHQFAPNFPRIDEFKKFEAIIKRSKGDSKTFTHKMLIDGKDSYVSVLRCSFLKHYLLISITHEDKVRAIFYKDLTTTIIFFSVFVLAGIILSIMMTKLIIIPINDLVTGIKAFASQNYEYRIPVRSLNEFGILAKECNKAAETIEKHNITNRIRTLLFPEQEFRCGSYIILTANSCSKIVASDFYDYIQLKQGTYAFIAAKVTGNDMSATYLISMIKTAFTLLCPTFPFSPEQILEKLNQIFIPYYEKGHLITALIGIIDPTNDAVLFSNAGYPYPICIDNKTKNKKFISLPSTPLGINKNTKYSKHKINIEKQTIVLYSEGATGLTDKNGKKIGHEAFLQVVENRHNSESKNLAKDILENLNEIAMKMPWQEDITILTVQNRI
ncbi:MAG: SpoIIE family protein phosphatase [Candidatus Riflebacteria bacterium]